jgi:hypothetical protein
MVDISKDTLEKIKKEKVHPKPRWYFLTRNYFFWLMFALTTVLGGISFGMIMFITSDLDWDIYHYLGISLPKAVLMSLPYLWIILLLLFLFITYYNFIHTRTGYRYRFIMIFFIGLIISGLMGLGLYQYGWTETVDRQLRIRIPGYHHLVYSRENQWMHPEKGLLSGIVVSLELENNLLQLRDYLDKEWEIDISQARVKGMFPLTQNLEIKILGQKLSEDNFKATEIRIPRGSAQGKGRKSGFN